MMKGCPDMKVTYLAQSGFLAETEKLYLLFDYFRGPLPVLSREKDLVVFVSHKHSDHYNRDIWNYIKDGFPATYVVSKDIPLSQGQRMKLKLSEEHRKRVIRVRAGEDYNIESTRGEKLKVKTLLSTDEGVAFSIETGDWNLYHAGDLNLWIWDEESAACNENMRNAYYKELDKIKHMEYDIAFLHVDGRQGAHMGEGLDYFIENIKVKHVFPMHFWEKYSDVARYLKNKGTKREGAVLYKLEGEGQSFEIC